MNILPITIVTFKIFQQHRHMENIQHFHIIFLKELLRWQAKKFFLYINTKPSQFMYMTQRSKKMRFLTIFHNMNNNQEYLLTTCIGCKCLKNWPIWRHKNMIKNRKHLYHNRKKQHWIVKFNLNNSCKIINS